MLVSKFPNHIFIPKIVPLVYDDTLSYYEFVCKLLNKVNEAITALNNLGIRVDALEEAVAELQRIVDSFDDRITACEGDISDLKTAVETINGAIENINTAIEGINTRVDNQQTVINNLSSSVTSITNIISNIQDQIAELEDLSDDVEALESSVSSLDTRVDALEEAAFGDLSVSPVNGNYSYDMRDLAGVDFAIETISGTGSSSTVFENSDHMISFHASEEGFVNKQLRLKNFITNLSPFDDSFGNLELNFGFCFQVGGMEFNKQVEFANGISVTQLLTGYTAGTIFTSIKLEANAVNKSYDLLINCNDNSSAYYIQLEHLFCVAGELVLSQSNMRNYVGFPTSNLIALIKKNAKDYDAAIASIEGRLDTDEGNITSQGNAITALQSAVGTFTQAQYNTYVNNTANTLNTMIGKINIQEQYYYYNVFDDVFDNKPEGLNIVYFNIIKQGRIVFLTMTASGFNNQQNYPTYKIGTLKPGLRSLLAVGTNCPVVFTGSTLHRTDDNPPRISVASSGNIRLPSVSDMNGVCTGVFNGDWQQNPFNMGSEYDNTKLDKYSLYVGLSNSTGGYYNACSFSFCYITDN